MKIDIYVKRRRPVQAARLDSYNFQEMTAWMSPVRAKEHSHEPGSCRGHFISFGQGIDYHVCNYGDWVVRSGETDFKVMSDWEFFETYVKLEDD
ncbi:MAG: hypothetical protein LBR80_04220 [Deltaproteobacteria bacterium]|jgi:hypothetical protein|nr:hypothetical protein [Deltaproteobacteria bacterium]